MFRSALYSLFAPAFRSRECHNIRPCTVQSLPLTEARLQDYRILCVRAHNVREIRTSGLMKGHWKRNMDEMLWHRRETRRTTEKTNIVLNYRASALLYPLFGTPGYGQ